MFRQLLDKESIVWLSKVHQRNDYDILGLMSRQLPTRQMGQASRGFTGTFV